MALKKKSDASAAAQTPAWHPNFRNYQQLPDIKVVRTAFFLNGTTAFIALGLLVWLGMREFELKNLKAQVAQNQSQIDENKKENDLAIANYQKFKAQEKRVTDVETFVKSKPIPSEILLRLAETRPKNIAFEFIDIRAPDTTPVVPPSMTLRANVRGTAGQALDEAIAYCEALRKDPVLGPMFEKVDLAGNSRDVASGYLKVEISITMKPAAAIKKS